ncbi:MAG: hypothetical protein Ct9H90mP13_01870 [Pseudomonadota bacterium]|nr:MAG: hypothetical protein Ct9H90mP13_01870 [Pseudomonadota bacterium]
MNLSMVVGHVAYDFVDGLDAIMAHWFLYPRDWSE